MDTHILSDQIELIENFNPREEQDYHLEDLEDTIKDDGIIAPLLVISTNKQTLDGRNIYKLFEGHRRFTSHIAEEKKSGASGRRWQKKKNLSGAFAK